MLRYITKRLWAGAISIFVLITLAFFMLHAIPGGPFSPDEQKNVPAEILERIQASYGLDKPVMEQYMNYWQSLLRGDLGTSMKYVGVSVNQKIDEQFPVSALVGILSVVFSLMMGISLGMLAAIRRKKFADYATMTFATIGISVPTFIMAVLMVLLFGQVLKMPLLWHDEPVNFILPVLCLSFTPIAYITRQTRSSMLEALENDYIRTARAKGVSEFRVVTRHALKNALSPVITYLGPLVAGLLTGSFVVEKVFNVPGIGAYFVKSISDRDYTMAMGIIVFYGIFVVVCSLLSDILLAAVDPRIKLDK